MFSSKPTVDETYRIIEHLKHWTSTIIDDYKEGAIKDPAMAKMLIQDEIHRVLLNTPKQEKLPPAYLRINSKSLSKVIDALKHENVLSLRWLGPRDETDEFVVYVVVKMLSFDHLGTLLDKLWEAKLNIRDGALGLFMR